MQRQFILARLSILFFLLCSSVSSRRISVVAESASLPFHVGVILDFETILGEMSGTSISLAIEDFYDEHPDYGTRLVLHRRDSSGDVVEAASEGEIVFRLLRLLE